MATSENSISAPFDLCNQIQEVTHQVRGAENTLRLFSAVDDDLGFMPDALTLLAEALKRISTDLDMISEKVNSLSATSSHVAS